MIRTHLVSCNFCGSENATFLYKAKDRLHGVEGEFNYVRCNDCSLVYMNPQVIPEDIAQIYPTDYAPHYSAATKGRFGLLSVVLNYLMNMAKIKKIVCKNLNSQSRVLDVGCGSGAFLNNIKAKTGCQVFGVDISENAVQAAKKLFGIDVFHGDIKDSIWPDCYFDIITAWQYLEHVNDPNQNIEKMSHLLKKDGVLIIAVPNFNSLLAVLFKEKWYHLDCPRHLCIWTQETITKLMHKYELNVLDIVYDVTPWSFMGSLQYLLYGDNINPKTKNRLTHSRFFQLLLFPFTLILSLFKQSDAITIYAQKVK
jgi:2-polyprenyl-3-methyl-5-hydroxy-6-metoxy-1,4-benzoquinol methylase